MSIFKNINVLDLTIGPVGGLTTMVMADFGASVIKLNHQKVILFVKCLLVQHGLEVKGAL